MSEYIPGDAPAPHTPPPGVPTAEERQWAMIVHLVALSALISGIGAILGPLIVWLIKKDSSAFVDDQGKEALNFNITTAIVFTALTVLGTVLLVVLVGVLFYLAAFVVGVVWLVLTIVAALKANEGVAYRYPLTLRLIK